MCTLPHLDFQTSHSLPNQTTILLLCFQNLRNTVYLRNNIILCDPSALSRRRSVPPFHPDYLSPSVLQVMFPGGRCLRVLLRWVQTISSPLTFGACATACVLVVCVCTVSFFPVAPSALCALCALCALWAMCALLAI